MIRNIILAGIGGGIGSALRYLFSQLVRNNNFPLSTLLINIIGSLIIGIIFGFNLKHAGWSENWKILLTAGFCGGFTTFSAFSYENVLLLQQGKYTLSILYIFSSIIAGILATYIGFKYLS